MRIGYLIASPRIAAKVRGHLPPWSVNTLAQAAGAWCFTQDRYRRKTLELVANERQRLALGLSAISGLTVFPAEANYLLVRMDRKLKPASRLKRDIFERHRILIRDCGSFEGLDDWYFRVAVRLPDQNDRPDRRHQKFDLNNLFLPSNSDFQVPGLELIRFVLEKQLVILAVAQVVAHEFRNYGEQPVYFLIAQSRGTRTLSISSSENF